jgi:hypothetical protein
MQAGADYGDLAPLMKSVGWLASATAAITLTAFGIKTAWAPVEEEIPGGASRIAFLITASLLGLLWFKAATDVTQGQWLLLALYIALGATIAGFASTYFGLSTLIYDHVISATVTKRIVGGLWLKSKAREEIKAADTTVQVYFRGNAYDQDRVWSRLSRGLAKLIFLLTYLAFIAAGSGAVAIGALLVLSARQPVIHEFSVSPLEVTPGQPIGLRWRVANADKTTLEPLGDVVSQGERTEQPVRNTVYTLTAQNSYGKRGVQLGVYVKPALSPPEIEAPKPASKGKEKSSVPPPPSDRSVYKEARDCDLIRGVVVRGDGWLQADRDQEGVAIASCNIDFPKAGKYEMFTQYASEGSRPVRVTLNKTILQENALAAATGGWGDPNWVDLTMGTVNVKQGINTVEFFTEHYFPHIRRLRFVPQP